MLATLSRRLNNIKLRSKRNLFDRTATQILQTLLKELAPGILLLAYSFSGAGLLYLVEIKSHHVELNQLYAQHTNQCISSVGFWGSLYYVNTLYTTIGYGNVYCCTTWGRTLTIIYTLVGIPLVVIVLDATGKLFFVNVGRLWFKFKALLNRIVEKFKRKLMKGSVIAVDGEQIICNHGWHTLPESSSREPDQSVDESSSTTLPVTVGVVFTVLWILLCALFFTITEGWQYSDAIYFTFISLTTVGLGDFAPMNYRLAVATFATVMIGLALVSMSIKIVQYNIEQLFEGMQKRILQEYKRRQLEGEENMVSIDNKEKKSGLLEAMMSGKQLKQLQELSDEKGRMRIKGVQAVAKMVDAEAGDPLITHDQTIQNVPLQADKGSLVEVIQWRSISATADFTDPAMKKVMKDASTSTRPMWK